MLPLGLLNPAGSGDTCTSSAGTVDAAVLGVVVGVWGDSLQITGTGRADFVCHSDTVFGTGPILDYGRSVRVGDVTCTSRQTGVECRVGASGHGFGLSRTAYQLF